jgi:hypothetical protein
MLWVVGDLIKKFGCNCFSSFKKRRETNPPPPFQCCRVCWESYQLSTTQHNTTQHNTTQHNTTQHNTTQHKTTSNKMSVLVCQHLQTNKT